MRIHNFLLHTDYGIITKNFEMQNIMLVLQLKYKQSYISRDHDDAGKEKFKDQTSLKVVLKHN